MNGTSSRHIVGVAEAIEEGLYKEKTEPLFSGTSAQGIESGWIVLDYVSVVVHIFLKPQREFYSLEHLWQDSKRVRIPPLQKRDGKRQTRRCSPFSSKRLSQKLKVR